MPINVPLIVLGVLIIVLLIWLRLSPSSSQKLRASLFRNVGASHSNAIGLLLGMVASLLPLTSSTWTIGTATWVFVGSLTITLVALVAVGSNTERVFDRFAWGLAVVIVLGFGIGTLIYQTRSWWIWLWRQYLRINEPHELVMEFLFILGVILGVFVVRNWGKEQKAFTESLTGILGGSFVAAIFGESLKAQGLTPMGALTFYGLGFVISAALNLLVAARLTANYTNKRSITSRAVLDFLYGSERAKTIDGYFLQNFKEDQDYAKQLLTETLLEYRKLVRLEFAHRMDERRRARLKRRIEWPQQDAEEQLTKCRDLRSKEIEERLLRKDLESTSRVTQDEKKQAEERLNSLVESIKELKGDLKPPTYYYQLIAIGCDPKKRGTKESPNVQDMDQEYDVTFKRLEPTNPQQNESTEITQEMFRVGVLARWEDVLEYIVAPGPYLASFRYFGSVAGLSLLVRQTIVMNRDRTKRFRSKDYRDGICPRDLEQWRGLDEIDYLSYISIPVVSRLGSSTENAIGVINVDTKVFVTPCKLEGEPINATEGIFRARLTPRELTEFAVNLYEENDRDVEYLEQLTEMITPVMELYSKCRIGAT